MTEFKKVSEYITCRIPCHPGHPHMCEIFRHANSANCQYCQAVSAEVKGYCLCCGENKTDCKCNCGEKGLFNINCPQHKSVLPDPSPKESDNNLLENKDELLKNWPVWRINVVDELLKLQHAKSSEEQRVRDAEIAHKIASNSPLTSQQLKKDGLYIQIWVDASIQIEQKILNQPNS